MNGCTFDGDGSPSAPSSIAQMQLRLWSAKNRAPS